MRFAMLTCRRGEPGNATCGKGARVCGRGFWAEGVAVCIYRRKWKKGSNCLEPFLLAAYRAYRCVLFLLLNFW